MMASPSPLLQPPCEGYLIKGPHIEYVSASCRSGWRKRWFVLTSTQLDYYDDARRRSLQGSVPLSHCRTLRAALLHHKFPNVFALETQNRTFFLSARSTEDKRRWIAALREMLGTRILPSPALPPEPAFFERIRTQALSYDNVPPLEVNFRNERLQTPLHIATQHDNGLHILLHFGADADAVDENGDTALHIGAAKSTDACVSDLLTASPDTNLRNHAGDTALQIAARVGCEGSVRLLLPLAPPSPSVLLDSEGYSLLQSALRNKVPFADEELLRRLINTDVLHNRDREGNTALHLACGLGRLSLVADILAISTADVALQNNRGWTPAMLSVAAAVPVTNQHTLALLCPPALVNVCNEDGDTVVHIAARKGHGPAVAFLVQSGADVSIVNKSGATPLLVALREGASYRRQLPAVLAHLIPASRVDVPLDPDSGNHVLHMLVQALDGSQDRIVAVCVKAGADVNAKNKQGKSALFVAAEEGATKFLIALLTRGGADVNSECKGESALERCCALGKTSTARVLISHKAACSKEKLVELATANHHKNILTLLGETLK
eukprot:m.99901 g.99901  ORF g.99901 m.99901 type:complete len:554 (-) comp18637_c0_seq1:114-1775(-)